MHTANTISAKSFIIMQKAGGANEQNNNVKAMLKLKLQNISDPI